jgi:hypothetical protein
MPRVVHFEIHADDPPRAIRFYSDVLGWKFTQWSGQTEYWLIETGPDDQPGINGGLIQRQGEIDGQAVIAYICTVDVPSVDDYAHKAVQAGGRIVVPKMAIPGVGWLVYCTDTEGNIFGMTEEDRQAA